MAKKIPMNKQEGKAQAAAAVFMVESYDRMQYAKSVYAHQSEQGQEAIDRIQSLLIRQSPKVMWVGPKDNRVSIEIPRDAIWNHALWMAVEILKDLSYMDIRVADFKWPSEMCMTCGKPVKTRKKVKRG